MKESGTAKEQLFFKRRNAIRRLSPLLASFRFRMFRLRLVPSGRCGFLFRDGRRCGVLLLRPCRESARGTLRSLPLCGSDLTSGRCRCYFRLAFFDRLGLCGARLLSLCFLFLFFRFLFRLFLDARELAKNGDTLLRISPFAAKLHFEKLLDDLVELRSARYSEGIELGQRKGLPQRPPPLHIIANLLECSRVRKLDLDKGEQFRGKARDIKICV